MSDSSLDYAEMIEFPISTCTVVHKKSKKRKRTNDELKNQLVDKVNKKMLESGSGAVDSTYAQGIEKSEEKKAEKTKITERGFKPSFIMIEFVIICVLCAVILLTNIFVPDSGINTFLRNTFFPESQSAEEIKDYTGFNATIPVAIDNLTVDSGIMTLAGELSVYSPCDGVISNISTIDDKYVVEITHSQKFKTVISGIDYAYFKVGDTVYNTIPVGYLNGEAKVYMYDSGSLLSNYSLSGGSIIWQV